MKISINGKRIIYTITILFNIIVRIPRIPGVVGNDSFEVLWMAQALKEILFKSSSGNSWLLNIFSYFGMYPFSHYPIGIPALLSFLLILGFSIENSFIIITCLEVIICFFGVKKLSELLYSKFEYKFIFISLYLFSPMFYRFSYFTVHPRGFILALLPYLIYHILKWQQSKEKKEIFYTLFYVLLLALTHRLWFACLSYVFYILLTEIFIYLFNNNKLDKYKKYITRAVLLISFHLLIFGYNFFNIDQGKINSPFISNTTIFGIIINLSLDYLTRIGYIVIFSMFGMINIYNIINSYMKKELKVEKEEKVEKEIPNEIRKQLFFFFFFTMICFTLIFTAYSTIIFLPIFIIFSIEGIKFLEKKWPKFFKNENLGPVFYISTLFFSLGYYWVQEIQFSLILSIFFIFTLILFIISILIRFPIREISSIFKKKIKNHHISTYINSILIMCCLGIYPLAIMDGNLIYSEKEFPYNYISDEEIEIINVLKNTEINGMIFIWNQQVSRAIGGYGFFETLGGNHIPQSLYYGWINESELRSNLSFSLSRIIYAEFLIYQGVNPEQAIINQVKNISANSTEGMDLLKEYRIQFCLAYKESNNIVPMIGGSNEFCNLINTSIDINPFYETNHLVLWKYY